ncbi:hypothetical protein [Azotobacter chroococcum]|uniref:Uncharacterized protein n=1 Tax=Azotobacter chroococcum TaxID=353 RepID=A0AAP9YH83_9GAMM|nr:hypothetical protein [Azotobacter chroococcum]QQE90445.1 hypothetical protein GKQ51_09310 [Azotobacter chroococcum]
MEQDKVRAEFEAAYRKARYVHVDGFDLRRLGDAYQCEHAQFAWDMWRASREAVVVVLPEEDKAGFGGDDGPLGPSIEQIEAAGYNCGVKACRAAIHAAGIRTR